MRKRNTESLETPDGSRKIRAVGYVRCSTDEQTRGDYNTLQSQKDYITNYIHAVHPEWDLVQFYEDGGYSGKNTNRPGLQTLLADCERDRMDVVITYKLDRITRSLCDFFELDRSFQSHNVSFLSVKEQFDTSTAMGRAMRNIALTFAELEREMVSERTKDKMVAQVKQGRWPGGNLPFGYNVENGRLMPNSSEAPVLGLIFDTYVRTKSLAAVRDAVTVLGIWPRNLKFRDGRNSTVKEWSKQKIYYILRNRVYLGELNYDGIRVENAHPPLVEQLTFDLAQLIVAEGIKGRPKLSVDHDYILAGKVICGHCGCRLSPKSTNHPNRKKSYTPYYECYRLSKYRGYECDVRRINADILEKLFISTIGKLSWDPHLIAHAVEEQAKLALETGELRLQEASLFERCREIESKIAKLLEAVEDGLAGTSVQARLADLERQRVILQSEISQIRAAIQQTDSKPIDVEEAMNLFRNCSELFEVMTLDEKEALVNLMLKKATVDKDKTVEFEFYVGEDTSYVAQNVKSGSPTWTRTTNILVNSQAL